MNACPSSPGRSVAIVAADHETTVRIDVPDPVRYAQLGIVDDRYPATHIADVTEGIDVRERWILPYAQSVRVLEACDVGRADRSETGRRDVQVPGAAAGHVQLE